LNTNIHNIHILRTMSDFRWKKRLPTRILGLMTPEEKKTLVSYEKEYKKLIEKIDKISSLMRDIPDTMVFNKKMNYYEVAKNKRKEKLHIEREHAGSSLYVLREKHAIFVTKLRKKYPKET